MNTELADIIRKARDGEVEAFRQVHEQYGRRILNFIFRMVGSREDAEDLTQNVFLIVFHEFKNLHDEMRFESWLYRIARNEVYQAFRKRKSKGDPDRNVPVLSSDGPFSPTDHRANPQDEVLREELGTTISRVLGSLPPKLREVFLLAVMHEKSYAEIAEIVGRSLLSVKTDIFRARSQARKELGRYLEAGR